MVGVATANYAAPDPSRPSGAEECGGHSIAFSGIVYWGGDGRAQEHKLVEGEKNEGIFLATFDLDVLRSYREQQTWGDAYRKPRAYGALVANKPSPVFRRNDSRR